MSWQRPNIGSRVTREGHARFWERPEVKFLRATRQGRRYRNAEGMAAPQSTAEEPRARDTALPCQDPTFMKPFLDRRSQPYGVIARPWTNRAVLLHCGHFSPVAAGPVEWKVALGVPPSGQPECFPKKLMPPVGRFRRPAALSREFRPRGRDPRPPRRTSQGWGREKPHRSRRHPYRRCARAGRSRPSFLRHI